MECVSVRFIYCNSKRNVVVLIGLVRVGGIMRGLKIYSKGTGEDKSSRPTLLNDQAI